MGCFESPYLSLAFTALLLVNSFHVDVFAQDDPCTSYEVLPWEGRMISNVVSDPNKMQCDRNLKENWYRVVDGPAGSDMPTSCPISFACGTRNPIWLNGALPDKEGEQIDVQVCVRSLTMCCSLAFNILIKNCGLYNVYKLSGADLQCDSAFCFGIHDPCPPGESSETGYQPGCSSNFPNIVGPAVVAFDPRWETEGNNLYYRCNLGTPADPTLVYDVKWFHNNALVLSVDARQHGQTYMSDKDWFKDGRKMGFDVSCHIRARDAPKSTPSPWLKSQAQFVGMTILTPRVDVLESGTGSLEFQLTAPFACPPGVPVNLCYIAIGFNQPEGDLNCNNPSYTIPDKCQAIIPQQNWTRPHRFTLEVKNDGIMRDVTTYVRLTTTKLDGYPTWSHYAMPSVMVVIQDRDRTFAAGPKCTSNNDPHMITFDGLRADFHHAGEFLLYRNKEYPVEIHAIFEMCPWDKYNPACNCGVAVRAGYDLYAIHRCNGYPNEGEVTCGGLGHLKVFDKDGGQTKKIVLPTGAVLWVKNSNSKFINLQLDAGMADQRKTDGICGNSDGDPGNDKIIFDFAQRNKYRIPDTRTYFTEEMKLPPWDDLTAGVCTCNVTGDRDPTLTCDWLPGVKACPPEEYRDLTCHKRSKRDVMQEDYTGFDFEAVGTITEAEADVDLTWKGDWTEAKAQQFCEDYLQKAAVIQLCQKDVGINVSSSVDMCVKDIQLIGDVQWAIDALEHAKGVCMTEVSRDPKYFEPDNSTANATIPSLKESLEAIGCSRDCNNQGDCVNGTCRCHPGFLGATCDVSATAPPDVMAIPRRGLCDVRDRPCRMTAVLGNNFVDSSKLTCRLSKILVNEGGVVEVGEAHTMPGVFESYGEVLCPTHTPRERRDTRSGLATSGAHGFLVAVANDGVNFGASRPFVIFDSRCLQCVQSGTTLNCTLKEDTCFIEGACYTSGESPFGQACIWCSPSHSTTQWTQRAGTCRVDGQCYSDGDLKPGDRCYVCDSNLSSTLWKTNSACVERKLWIIGIVMGSALLLVIALVVFWKFKINRKMRVKASNTDLSSFPPSSTRQA